MTSLDDITIHSELDTLVHHLTYVSRIRCNGRTGRQRKALHIEQVCGLLVEVIDGTVQTVVEESEVSTDVPLTALLPCQVRVAAEHLNRGV